MTAQELLDALNKVQDKTNLNPTAVWALIEYLKETWKDRLGKSVRPFDLGDATSRFYVDLSQNRLPERIRKYAPGTEPMLRKFFGAAESNLPQFWGRCVEIWSVALESYPDFAKEVKKYFDMLLQSSLQRKHATSPSTSIESSVPVASEPLKVPEMETIPVTTGDKNVAETPALPSVPKDEPGLKVLPKNAYLVLSGRWVIPLNQSLIKIGRDLDNHIILEDPRVSRSHAQLNLINDRFVIFDMNSTGGTYVNNQRVDQAVLYPGDVISLAGASFIFSQEMPAKPGEAITIELGSPFPADRSTAVIRWENGKPIKKTDETNLPNLPKTKPL